MYDTIGRIGVPFLWILGRPQNLGHCVPVGSSLNYPRCSIKLLSLSSKSFFVTFDTMLQVGSFFSLVYGPLLRCSLYFLMQSSLSSTTMAIPLSAGRMMMFSFCWRDFRMLTAFL